MSNHQESVVASRPVATVLAIALVAALSVPAVMLPRATAVAASAPLPCIENNHNGCTELSPTPPEDTVAVPPNIVLMLDDSGSMNWDVMPDYASMPSSEQTTEGMIDSAVNGLYYDPTVVYTLPPQVDGTPYPASSFSAAPIDGFNSSSATVDLSTYRGRYDSSDTNYTSTAVQYSISMPKVGATTYAAATGCPTGTSKSSVYPGYCYWTGLPSASQWFSFTDISNHDYYVSRCQSVSDVYNDSNKTCTPGISFFTYTTGPVGSYVRHYVGANAGDCSAAGLSSSVCDDSAAARQNVANWFSYYHTRVLTAKSGLTTAFNNLNPKYRFGFGSIDGGNNGALPSLTATFGSNTIAEVQPFGDGSPGTQRAAFWNWITTLVPPHSGTPLRLALQAVGKYYKSSQPWTTMSSDPGWTSGSTTQFACRASYTILTTDGFWNGSDPSGIGNADGANGPTYSPPAGKTYTVTGYVAAAPYQDSYSTTLADVAMYYWEHDLQPGLPDEVAPSPADPAFWQHMTTFTMGLGFTPVNIQGTDAAGNPVTVPEIFAWAHNVDAGDPTAGAITNFAWPQPSSNSVNNLADLAHAAVDGHGDFFNAQNPQQVAQGFAKAIADISARNVAPTPAAVNASVATVGAVAFQTGYNTGDWSGSLNAAVLKTDGTIQATPLLWDAGALLEKTYHGAGYAARSVYTDAYNAPSPVPAAGAACTPGTTGFSGGFAFAPGASFDCVERAGLLSPAPTVTNDTLEHRIDFLLGDNSLESTVYRTRTTLLGAIIHSEPVYVQGATGDYFDTWPTLPGGGTAPEAAGTAQSYDAYVNQQSTEPGMLYVGANDGMLHAFNAPPPKCTGTIDAQGNCTAYTFSGTTQGTEAWAFVPRAVYANLGNLTSRDNFSYRPTVDATPVVRDVFYASKWHTILTGGVGLGGRGVYALDITDPSSFSASDVMWELDSDMAPTAGCVASYGSCQATDLGYTISQPNIARLADGTWVVLVPNGYFPDCSTPDTPTNDTTNCQAIASQVPLDKSSNPNGVPYSALFVLNAQTGAMIAELKTPTNISGVTSFGLATPVLGDYNNDQVDDVAFAGDAQGNLWRFDLCGGSSLSACSSDPKNWTVTLVYKGATDAAGNQGVQPITTMPRLFPDPSTNRFMVVFGTGKFLGVGDNSSTVVQGLYGVRDNGKTYTQADLTPQYLHESLASATLPDPSGGGGTVPNPLAGTLLRCVTGSATDTDCSAPTPVNAVPASSGGWYIALKTTDAGKQNDAGERVVVSPGAIFASNTVVFETLITGGQTSDPCSPTTAGAIFALNATTGGSAGVTSLGGGSAIAGARIGSARTSGSLPVVSALGGGQAYLPGTSIGTNKSPLGIDAPIWRRRSWNEINQNQ